MSRLNHHRSIDMGHNSKAKPTKGIRSWKWEDLPDISSSVVTMPGDRLWMPTFGICCIFSSACNSPCLSSEQTLGSACIPDEGCDKGWYIEQGLTSPFGTSGAASCQGPNAEGACPCCCAMDWRLYGMQGLAPAAFQPEAAEGQGPGYLRVLSNPDLEGDTIGTLSRTVSTEKALSWTDESSWLEMQGACQPPLPHDRDAFC